MSAPKRYYKFVEKQGRKFRGPYSGFDFTPYIPVGHRKPPKTPFIETLEDCVTGWHVMTRRDIPNWIGLEFMSSDAFVFEVEVFGKGKRVGWDYKSIFHQIRFVRKVNPMSIAEYEKKYPAKGKK